MDWEWIRRLPALVERRHARLIRFEDPLVIKMNGRNNEGVILKPESMR